MPTDGGYRGASSLDGDADLQKAIRDLDSGDLDVRGSGAVRLHTACTGGLDISAAIPALARAAASSPSKSASTRRACAC